MARTEAKTVRWKEARQRAEKGRGEEKKGGEKGDTKDGMPCCHFWCLHQPWCLEGASSRLAISKQRLHIQASAFGWVT